MLGETFTFVTHFQPAPPNFPTGPFLSWQFVNPPSNCWLHETLTLSVLFVFCVTGKEKPKTKRISYFHRTPKIIEKTNTHKHNKKGTSLARRKKTRKSQKTPPHPPQKKTKRFFVYQLEVVLRMDSVIFHQLLAKKLMIFAVELPVLTAHLLIAWLHVKISGYTPEGPYDHTRFLKGFSERGVWRLAILPCEKPSPK